MSTARQLTRRELFHAAGAAGLVALGGGASGAEPAKTETRLPHAQAEDIGLDPRRLQVAYDLLEKWTTGPDAVVPGGAILVGRNGKIVPPRYFGRQGPEPKDPPIRKDAMFLMASITKPITYLGALMLV